METPSLPFDINLNSSFVHQDAGRANANNPVIGPPLQSYGLWDASVALVDRDDRYRVTFIVKNITDEFYTTARVTSTYIRQQVPRDSERYYGVTIRANFGG